ncbi:MAG: hypothetical protein NTW99_07500 [Chloroflexi bacterium]|nr:hypothetical protein [Chloroflexota bacterium]
MREGQHDGTTTGDSGQRAYASRMPPRPVGVDGTIGLDGAHVGGAGRRRERRRMVQPD